MTTLLDSPAQAGAAAPPAVAVRVATLPLPPHDPLELFTALRERAGETEVFLLESLEAPAQDGGTAVVGCGRLAEIRVHADRIAVDAPAPLAAPLLAAVDAAGLAPLPDGSRALGADTDVWDVLRAVQSVFRVETDAAPDTYAFGFLTTVGYGAAWHMERLPERAGESGPDLVLALFRDVVRYDLDAGTAERLAATSERFPPAAEDLVEEGLAALRPAGPLPRAPEPRAVRDSTDRDSYLESVARCLRHIGVGDVYQIQIGHRIEVDTELTPLQVYRRLRHRNPSPYMYLVPREGTTLIGASPEVLYRTEGGQLMMRPIAGTAPRSGDPAVDGPRIEALRASEKERAEHVMLVDLCRNDIGRVAVPGSLAVPSLMTVETYSHVFHLVSTVEGRLAAGQDAWSTLCATFPAGTVTGAPKIRAMELIADMESAPRGMYAGAVGLVDVRGWSRLALCIRTVTHDGTGYSTQSCAGIVADSEPAAEWRETLHKMGAAYWALTGRELAP
ncbi:anthranilate synthase component 1 [Streptomyces sp. TverLS-915]|uniref:anthranilate synthase component I family protein n=1 Tax=unclassified Streptomyces TaxID=2593676 RepID=UPI00081D693B|nr:anthranilate synthase component I family protein [Streptomyces sp. TverLS-915]SCD72770.1 anthranilate synthase component 1 [Streptomyces sp. TverLS-915]